MLPVGAGCWAETAMGKRSGRASAETRRTIREHRVMRVFLPPFIGSAAGIPETPSTPFGHRKSEGDDGTRRIGQRAAQTQKSAEGTPTNLASPWHTVTELVLRQLPREWAKLPTHRRKYCTVETTRTIF